MRAYVVVYVVFVYFVCVSKRVCLCLCMSVCMCVLVYQRICEQCTLSTAFMLAVSCLAEVSVVFDNRPASVANVYSAGANHFIATLCFVEACLALWTLPDPAYIHTVVWSIYDMTKTR